LKKNTCLFYLLSAMAFLILSGCGFGDKKEETAKVLEVKNEYSVDELSIQLGLRLFNENCASCHSFKENEIGPNLAGITSEVDKAWLVAFIKDPAAVIKSGDERAVKTFEKYKLYMPAFPMLEDKEIEGLLGFIHKFSNAEKRTVNNRPGGLLNPIPEKIPLSDLTLVIEEWLTVPASSENSPLARINKLSAIETQQGERLFIVDLRGKLYEIKENKTHVYFNLQAEKSTFIDNPGWGTGFGSFAFHPNFEKNGLLYTTHTEPPKTAPADFAINDSIETKLQWILTEWKTDTPKSDTFSGKPRELLRADMHGGAHGFQEITFNPLAKSGAPDYGMLYLGIGDGSAGLGDYSYLCDSNRYIWGSVVRINPSGNNSVNGNYGIPKDNPFVNDPDALGEIWCRGFRNAHRISWDETGSGKMLISNIGQHSVEEVNIGKAGADYGWPFREGTFLFDKNANTELVYPLPPDDSAYTYPVIQYDHDEGNAVSGGFVYAGFKVPELKNKYVFGDIPRGTLFYSEMSEVIEGKQAAIYRLNLEINGKPTSLQSISPDERVNLRFGTDSSGELYIFTKSNGKVYKVIGCKDAVL